MTLDSRNTASTRSETDMHAALCGCRCSEFPPAEHVELSLDSDILDALHAMGEDWESHFNGILREWLRSNSPMPVLL